MIAFAGSVPENYHRYLGSVLFEPYAQDLARRIGKADRILEIACGTGIVTNVLIDRLPQTMIVATDLNQGMIDIAKQHVDSKRVTWRQADATKLPFGDGDFDAVVCQFGFMFVPDKLAAFHEAHRVLRDGGLLAFSVWDGLEENQGSRIVNEVAQKMFRDDPPKFIEMPYSMHDRPQIERLLREAGFDRIQVGDVRFTMQSPTARHFATGMVRGTPLYDAVQQRGGDPDRIIASIEEILKRECGDKPMRAPMGAIVVEAR